MNRILASIILGLLGLAMQLSAQNPLPYYDTVEVKVIELNEVVVKSARESSVMIKNLPASISLMKSKTIENQGMSSLKDLVGFVPNFFMPDYGSRLTSPVYIRGIGSRINSPSVGLYVDNVPYFEKAAFDFEFNDIERIEVLRGPQGTSYGRNTMGGLIKVYTKEPTDIKETKISLSGGNYGYFRSEASHSQYISKKTSVALSGFYGRNDGYFKNEFLNSKVDKDDYFGGHIKVINNISDRTKLQVSSGYESSKQGGYPYANIDLKTNDIAPISYNFYSSYDRDILSSAVVLDHSTQNLVFQSVTSHQFLKDDQNIDQDFTSKDLVFVNQNTNQNSLSQEFTVKNKPGKKFTWIAGAFGFIQMLDDQVTVTYGDDAATLRKKPGDMSVKEYDNNIKGAAIFGETSLNNLFTKGLTLTTGIRFDYEEAIQDFLFNTYNAEGAQKLMDDSKGIVNYTEILPKASLGYNMNQNASVYTTVAKGYKTGGFNTTFERPEDRNFKPEYSWNYEAGIKTIYLNKRLLTNFSVFYIDWKDQQIYQAVPSGNGSMLKNAGHSVSKGYEIEMMVRPTNNLSVNLSYGYTDAKFLDYQRRDTVNYKGNYIPYAPENTFMMGADYSIPVKSGMIDRIVIFANYQGQGKIYWNEENSASQNFYGLLNGKISIMSKYARLDLWAKNILNEDYHSFYFSSLGKSFVQVGKPFQFGANLIITF